MTATRFRNIAQNTGLVLLSLFFSFVVLEIGFRILDPTPYFTDAEKNNTEHGNLSMYDATLGWKGVPGAQAEFVTRNNRVWLAHNRHGFRDIEHALDSTGNPAIVFLGDSFTWGYEVEFDEMFVNRLRERFIDYELFNLAHRGYGTDQSYLTFKTWDTKQPVALVVLMFSENDVGDNSSALNYAKAKPKFALENGELVLTGVPVPSEEGWQAPPVEATSPESAKDVIKNFIYRSHLINHIRIRFKLLRQQRRASRSNDTSTEETLTPDYALTSRILSALKGEVALRGAKLVLVFIPSKREVENLDDSTPYQAAIAALCEQLALDYFDLAPALKKAYLRTYYLEGMHWTSHGHKLAAEALSDFLRQQLDVHADSPD